ncbi:hypothetical protein [Heyndrickxia sporothermodurans]|uniref:hypothetical protein n=1 Tax=Heyndrickxia sporothermodurans TaxID=46224 RepID=UPI000D39C7C0|nr:hypothetical protein [Heyndrickxia sporothermodurans]PTY93058.1 hypothetical protein B5V90_02945 [Heyndrickxia sporothermodurans]
MANLEGMRNKFTVVKNDDLEKYLHPEMKSAFLNIAEKVELNKCIEENKKPHTYLVINTDEPYADEVIEIMKKHGHWG